MAEKSVPKLQVKLYNVATDRVLIANKAGVVCRHCHKSKVNRPRGLCWHCYYTEGVKELYPSTSKYAMRGIGNGMNFNPPPDPEGPTRFAPGTPEKLEVLVRRAKLRYAIFHEFDAAFAGDVRTERWFLFNGDDSLTNRVDDVLLRQAG